MSTYSTYNEAVEAEIVAPIATSEDVLGKPVREAFDVDAIADATIVQRVPERGDVLYCVNPDIDADEFWAIVMNNAR